jgi:hypothetical protein
LLGGLFFTDRQEGKKDVTGSWLSASGDGWIRLTRKTGAPPPGEYWHFETWLKHSPQ